METASEQNREMKSDVGNDKNVLTNDDRIRTMSEKELAYLPDFQASSSSWNDKENAKTEWAAHFMGRFERQV